MSQRVGDPERYVYRVRCPLRCGFADEALFSDAVAASDALATHLPTHSSPALAEMVFSRTLAESVTSYRLVPERETVTPR